MKVERKDVYSYIVELSSDEFIILRDESERLKISSEELLYTKISLGLFNSFESETGK